MDNADCREPAVSPHAGGADSGRGRRAEREPPPGPGGRDRTAALLGRDSRRCRHARCCSRRRSLRRQCLIRGVDGLDGGGTRWALVPAAVLARVLRRDAVHAVAGGPRAGRACGQRRVPGLGQGADLRGQRGALRAGVCGGSEARCAELRVTCDRRDASGQLRCVEHLPRDSLGLAGYAAPVARGRARCGANDPKAGGDRRPAVRARGRDQGDGALGARGHRRMALAAQPKAARRLWAGPRGGDRAPRRRLRGADGRTLAAAGARIHVCGQWPLVTLGGSPSLLPARFA